MAHINTIDRYLAPIKQDGVGHTSRDTTTEQDKECSPLLRVPAEIRNKIWRDVLGDAKWKNLRDLEKLTQVNRQVRSETLPICYEKPYTLFIDVEPSADWARCVEKVVEGLSAKSGSPGSSPLHHLSGLRLALCAPYTVTPATSLMLNIDFYLTKDHGEAMEEEHEAMMREATFEATMEDGDEEMMEQFDMDYPDPDRLVVGSPDMDWTDAETVRAACDEAATQLESNRWRHIYEMEEARLGPGPWAERRATGPEMGMFFIKRGNPVTSFYTAHARAAMDALYALIPACPHLKNVAILDKSDPVTVVIY